MLRKHDLSDQERDQLQKIVKDFESSLGAEGPLSIEEVVTSASDRLKLAVLEQLVRADVRFHSRSDSVPSMVSYCERFPDQSDLVRTAYREGLVSDSKLLSGKDFDTSGVETQLLSSLEQDTDLSHTFDLRSSTASNTGETGSMTGPSFDQKYVVQQEIDRGGMGVVLQVKDRNLNRTLAMKVIRGQENLTKGASGNRNEERIDRFLREASITGRLEHPGVVPVHELGTDRNGRSYFTMKYVQGKTLKRIFRELQAGKCSLSLVIEVLIKVCDTIAFAHSKGVIHRDLKPANIMVGEFGETYVMDWGLAKILREPEESSGKQAFKSDPELQLEDSHTMHGAVIGTPHYMPPEQAAGQVDELDERTDIYSIGALLYEVLSGRKPFADLASATDVLEQVCTQPPIPINADSRKAPPELVAIANKAMQQKKEDRYAGAAEIAADLRAYLSNRVVQAYRTGLLAVVEKWLVRNQTLIATAVLLLVVSLSVIAMLQYNSSRVLKGKNKNLQTQRDKLDRQAEQLRDNIQRREEALAKEKLASDKLRGQKLVLYANNAMADNADATLSALLATEALEKYKYESPDTRSAIYAAAAKLNQQQILNGHGQRVIQADFSPDNKLLVSVSADGTGIVWDVESGEKVSLLVNKNLASLTDVVFSRDSKLIFAAGDNGTVGSWEAATGFRRHMIELGGPVGDSTRRSRIAKLSLSTDGATLCAASATGCFLLEAATGKLLHAIELNRNSPPQITGLLTTPDAQRVLIGTRKQGLLVWEPASGVLKNWRPSPDTQTPEFKRVRNMQLSADGTLLVTTHWDEQENPRPAMIWNVKTGELKNTISSGNGVTAVTFHPNPKLLIAAVSDGGDSWLQVWDIDRKKVVAKSSVLPSVVESISVSHSGDRFVTLDGNSHQSLWDLHPAPGSDYSIHPIEDLVGHSGRVNEVMFSGDDLKIASVSDDRTVRIWNAGSNRAVPYLGHAIPSHFYNRINAAGTRILLVAPDKKTATLWSYPEMQLIKKLTPNAEISICMFSRGGDLVFLGLTSDDAVCWSAADGSPLRTFDGIGRLHEAFFQPESNRLMMRTSKMAAAWNMDQAAPLAEFPRSEGDMDILSTDGSFILRFFNSDYSLSKIDTVSGETSTIPVESCHPEGFSSDGRLFRCRGPLVPGSAKVSTSVLILDGSSFEVKHRFGDDESDAPVRWIRRSGLSPDGTKIWIHHQKPQDYADPRPAFSVWSTVDGSLICEFGDYDFQSYVIPYGTNRDLSRILLHTRDGIKIVDGSNGQTVAILPRSMGEKFPTARFSSDSKLVVSCELAATRDVKTGAEISEVAIWDAVRGHLVARLPRNRNFRLLGFVGNSRHFLTFNDQFEVSAWPLDIVNLTRHHLARSLTPIEQGFYLADDVAVNAPADPKLTVDLPELEAQVRLLGPVTPDRRAAAWSVLEQLERWVEDHPGTANLDRAIQTAKNLLSGPSDSDPTTLMTLARFQSIRGDKLSAIQLLEQATRHPQAMTAGVSRLESARQELLPAVASFCSADALAERLLGEDQNPADLEKVLEWAQRNNPPLGDYLNALQHFSRNEFSEAEQLLASVIATGPSEPEPYLLLARCLLQNSQPERAVAVLRGALESELCLAPEIWNQWLQLSFSQLKMSPQDLLRDLPASQQPGTSPAGHVTDVRWLLNRLTEGGPLRINCGWYVDTRTDGEDWSADRFYTYGFGFFEMTGEAQTFAGPIDNTEQDLLYQTERFFPVGGHRPPAGYQIPVPNGKYLVTVGFSEIFDELRSFQVEVEGSTVVDQYDPPLARAEEFQVETEVRDGLLNIHLKSNNENPAKISTVSVQLISELE